jgi:hypothetical protein
MNGFKIICRRESWAALGEQRELKATEGTIHFIIIIILQQHTLIKLGGFILRVALDVFAEPFVELIMRVEQKWHDEMQQRPELDG